MSLAEALLAAIIQWAPPWYPPGKNPETPEQYEARLATISTAVALEAASVTWPLGEEAMAAAVLTIWHGETRFAYEVHALGKSYWGQDDGKAKCLGQIHHNRIVTKEQWLQTEGASLEATRNCANATMRMVQAMAHQCSVRSKDVREVEKMFSAYGSGRGCQVRDVPRARARRWQWLLGEVKKAMAAPPAKPPKGRRRPD